MVPGREHRTYFRRDARGNLLEFLESGYAPRLDGASAPQRIDRRTRLRYETVAGRLLLKEIDGPLPNGPAGDPSDSATPGSAAGRSEPGMRRPSRLRNSA